MKKKLLYLSLVICSAFVSCGSEDSKADEKANAASISPTSTSLYRNGTKQLTGTNVTSWKSNNDFVASVDENGLVKGAHVGTTQIIGSNGKTSAVCEVEVKATYNLYDSPILEWDASLATIKNKETHKLESEDYDMLIYSYSIEKEKTTYPTAYVFENNKLSCVIVMVPYSRFYGVINHLSDRYNQLSLDEKNYKAVYINGYNKETHNMGIVAEAISIKAGKFIQITYMPYKE